MCRTTAGRKSSPARAASSIDLPGYDDVVRAAWRLAGVAHRTPVLTSRTADAQAGAQLFFKCENFQRAGAFKFRGAYNAIAALDDALRARGVLACSSGNHAQAVALACSLFGITATIVMPRDAPAAKVAATRGYGAEIVFYDRYGEDREAIAAKLAAERGLALISPFDHVDVISGAGTAAMELFEEVRGLDAIVVPLGGGGLLAGACLAAEGLRPSCAIVGVEPEAGDDGRQSLAAGEVVTIPVPRSIADGALTTHLGRHTFPIIYEIITFIAPVSDVQLVEAMRFFAERMKLVVEPTGCLAAAAVLSGVVAFPGKRVGVIVSGGNVDRAALADFLSR